ncbi:MAG: cation diffusion facilitator family transporter [Rickettsiales bacterium]|nr:cation diffusion facilitator family transporter [Rickettsiales bacterium]
MNTHADHAHAHEQIGFSRAFAVGIALNTAFIVAEIVYGLQADSLSLLADAGHNASDVLGLCLAWGAMLLSRKRASESYTYGLQSASIIAALANALMLLFALAGIGYEAYMRFQSPALPATETVMWVAGFGVLVNGVTAWFFHKGGHDLNVRGAFLHMAADAGVSAGVVISALAIAQTGWLWLDPAVSLCIVLVIFLGTWGLLKDSLRLILHAVPRQVDMTALRAYLQALPAVKEVHDLHVWAISTTGTALSAHLVIPTGHPGDAFLHHLTHELEHRFNISHATIQIEIGDHCHQECDHH